MRQINSKIPYSSLKKARAISNTEQKPVYNQKSRIISMFHVKHPAIECIYVKKQDKKQEKKQFATYTYSNI